MTSFLFFFLSYFEGKQLGSKGNNSVQREKISCTRLIWACTIYSKRCEYLLEFHRESLWYSIKRSFYHVYFEFMVHNLVTISYLRLFFFLNNSLQLMCFVCFYGQNSVCICVFFPSHPFLILWEIPFCPFIWSRPFIREMRVDMWVSTFIHLKRQRDNFLTLLH